MTPLDPFDVITPLGPAVCIGIIDNITNIEWVTFIKTTGEPWFWRNPFIRLQSSITENRPTVSPFINLSPLLEDQINRYKNNGWLS